MPDPDPLRIAELSPEEEDLGFRLFLGGLLEPQFRQQVADLRASCQRQPSSGYRVLGAFRGERLTGSILALTQPGRTAVIWPPRLVTGEPQATARELLRAGQAHLPQLGIRLAQALLPSNATADKELLTAAGFRHASDLLYLVCLADDFPAASPSPQLQFEPYSSRLHARFTRLVDATYEDTLDCPAVNGVRSVEDVLEGYMATGHFDPNRWFMVRHRGEEIGCLILTDYPENAIWELIYMGLAPAARGHGHGLAIVRMRSGWPGRQRGIVSCWPWTRPMNRRCECTRPLDFSRGTKPRSTFAFWSSRSKKVGLAGQPVYSPMPSAAHGASESPLFTERNVAHRLAVEHFFHAGGNGGRSEKKVACSFTTTKIFGEIGAALPEKIRRGSDKG